MAQDLQYDLYRGIKNKTSFKMSHFTVEQGLKLQSESLRYYKKILKKSWFERLQSWCFIHNKELTDKHTGYDVKRGGDLSGLVETFMCELRNKDLEKNLK